MRVRLGSMPTIAIIQVMIWSDSSELTQEAREKMDKITVGRYLQCDYHGTTAA